MEIETIISVLVPSRRRATSLQEFLQSLFENAKFKDRIEVWVYLDQDEIQEYPLIDNVRYIRGTKTNLSSMYNLCAEKAKGDLFFLAADDIRIKMENWDEVINSIFDAFADTFIVVHGDDLGVDPLKFGTHFFLHRNWYQSLGKVWPESAIGRSDVWMSNLADKLGKRVFLSDLVVEHLHPSWGKSKLDSTYLQGLKSANLEAKKIGSDILLSEAISEAENILRASPLFVPSNLKSPLVINCYREEVPFTRTEPFSARFLKFLRWMIIRFRIWFST